MAAHAIQTNAVPIRPWTSADVHAAVEAAPPALCADSAQEGVLLGLKPCDTFAELLVQLYPTHTGNLAGAGRLAERLAERRDVTVPGGSIDLDQSDIPYRGHVGVVGDLTVEGDLSVVAALVVTGNLVVTGTLSDCGPESRIVVLGDLRCQHVKTSGWVTVAGNVSVDGVLFGSYNDDVFEAHGSISAGAVITDEHSFEAEEGFSTRNAPAEEGDWGPEIFDLRNEDHLAELKAILGPEAIDGDDSLVWERLPSTL